MTIEEAITTLTDIKEWGRSPGGFGRYCTDEIESLDMAISALRAQQEAEKNENGCKYCRDCDVIAWDMCNDAVTIQTDGRIHIIGGGDWECEINYCPMCGRQLRHPPKEAHDA